MPMDTFICGECQLAFHDIAQFVQHKNEACPQGQKVEGHIEEVQGDVEQQTVIINYEEPLVEEDMGGGEMQHIQTGEETVLMEVNLEEAETIEQALPAEYINAMTEQVAPEPGIELVPVAQAGDILGTQPIDLQIIVKSSDSTTAAPARRRGRPRKGEEKNPKPKKEPPPPKPETEKPEAERTEDGKLHCPRCKKTFNRERHFKTHKCLAYGDYVDLTKRDVASSLAEEIGGDSEEEEYRELAEEADEDDFKLVTPIKAPKKPGRGRGRPPLYPKPAVTPKPVSKPEGILLVEASGKEDAIKAGDQTGDSQNLRTSTKSDTVGVITLDTTPEPSAPRPESNAAEGTAGEGEKKNWDETKMQMEFDEAEIEPSVAIGGKIPNKPVFSDPDDKAKFDLSLNVDLSVVDHMFKTHVINQDVNENAPPPSSRTLDRLSVFSCNTCEKVFMSLSHVRLHCLIHTTLKPFACTKCDYTTNTKGNLYTHMRRHTGQLYKCPNCPFKSVNKGHLLEHQAIHNNARQMCKLCKRDYNTPKSLLNHVRKYHGHTAKGKEYLDSFQGKHNRGPAVLHQCHVCNRKFKKKNDRDRHLLVHNIHMSEQLYQCGVCEYISARRAYLEKHISRHRIIYACALCEGKFPSTVRLNQHISEAHLNGEQEITEEWQALLNQCLEVSLFLPEPDGSMDDWMQNNEPEQIPPEEEAGGMDEQEMVEETATVAESVEAVNEGSSEVTDDAEAVEKQDATDADIMDWARKLGYRKMGIDVFHKLQSAFGNEECEFCGRLFTGKSECDLHLRTHTGEKPFPCEQCSFRSASKENLRRHVEREHDKVEYQCGECEFVANTRSQLWTHTQKHKPPVVIKCSKCDATFDGYKKMKVHLQIKHPELTQIEMKNELAAFHRAGARLGRRSWQCPYCNKQFTRGSSDLQKHIWIHEGVKPFVCPEEGCGHACRSKSNLAVHMLKHSSHKPFTCQYCQKAYKSRTALRWHVRTHKDGKMFKCDKCPYEASQRSHLKRHMETHDIVKRFMCAHCDYSANTIGYIKIHYTRNHKGQVYNFNTQVPRAAPIKSAASADSRVYKCLSCDYLFGNLSDMKRHLRVRHHVPVDDMKNLEQLDATPVTPAPDAAQHVPPSEVQVVHVQDASSMGVCSTEEQDATTALQALQYAGTTETTIDAKAVNIIQHIMDMSGQSQQITIHPDDDQTGLMSVNPETIIVQQHGEEVVVSSNADQEGAQQYVIQYVTTDEALEQTIEGSGMEGVEEAISEGVLEIVGGEGLEQHEVSQEQVEIVGHIVTDDGEVEQAEMTIQEVQEPENIEEMQTE